MSSEKIIDRLRKLIRLGESSNEHEAQNALTQAAKLAAEYHLDLASIDTEDDAKQLGKRTSDVVIWGKRKRKYRWQLAHVVARAWGCAPWTISKLTIDFEPGHAPSESEVESIFDLYLQVQRGQNRMPSYKIEAGPLPKLVMSSVFGEAPDGDIYSHDFPHATKFTTSHHLVMFGRRGAAGAAVYVYHVLLQCVDDIAKGVSTGRTGLNSARWGIVFGLGDKLARDLEDDELLDDPTFAEDVKSTALVLAEAQDEATRFLNDNFGEEAYKKGPDVDVKDRASFLAGRRAAEDIEIPDPSNGRSSLGGSTALPAGSDRQLA